MMLSAFAAPGAYSDHWRNRPVPVVYGRAPTAEGRPLPAFGLAGTGGTESTSYFLARAGYPVFEFVRVQVAAPAVVEAPATSAPFVDLMLEVKAGFGRTMSSLPGVFGVSRQTLYNWLAGEVPKEQHQPKLQELAAAARVFQRAGFKPTAVHLERTVMGSKSLLNLLSEGGNGEEAARRLIRISNRDAQALSKLDAILGNRKAGPFDASDFGAPALDEGA